MPFQISLSKTDSPKNRITKALSDTITFSFVFKAPTSYLSPVVLIQSDTLLIGYNYAQIRLDILRFYYVTDIILVSSKNYEVHLREDVLATYSSTITSQSLFIERTSNPTLYDVNIKDNLKPKEYIQKTMKSIATKDLIQVSDLSSDGVMVMREGFQYPAVVTGPKYAVIVAKSGSPISFSWENFGKVPDRNKTISYIPVPSDYPSVYMYCCSYDTMIYLMKWCAAHAEEAKSIIGIAMYPYDIPHGDVVHTIRIAGNDVSTNDGSTGVEAYYKSSYYPISIEPIVLADFKWYPFLASNALGAEVGDVNFQLFLPYLGTITLDNSLLSEGDEIQVVYIPFYASNECLLMVSNVTKNVILHSDTISIGQEIPLTLSNAEAIRDTWTKIGIKTSVSLVADTLKIASGNPLGALSAVGSIARNAGDIVSTALTTHYHSSVKVTSATSGIAQWNKCYLTITKPEYTLKHDDNVHYGDYVNRFGIPCEKFSKLVSANDKDTYYKTNTDRLIGTMTDTERSEIISYLNNGVVVPPPPPSE